MNTSLKTISLLASAALFTLSNLPAVETDPVGYVTQTSANGDDTVVYPQLLNPSDLVGSPSDVTSGTLTVGSDLSEDSFKDSHFVLFCDGDLVGEWFQITGNTLNTISVAEDLEALGASTSDSIKVIAFWTLDTLFPEGDGFPGSADVTDPVAFILTNNPAATGTNYAPGNSFFYHTGEQTDEGWYLDGDFSDTVGDTPLSPETYFTIRNSSGEDVQFTAVGSVPVDLLATNIGRLVNGPQDNQLVNPYPSPLSLDDSGLVSSGAFEPSPDVTDPVDLLLIYDNDESSGTNVAPTKTYLYHSGEQTTAGWYLDGQFAETAGSDTIPAGGAFVVRKADGNAGVVKWTAPIPYASEL